MRAGWAELLLGLDVGTTRAKATVIDRAGQEHGFAAVRTPFGSVSDGVEMEVADLQQALMDVVAALGPAREGVAAVGVAGMAESGAPFRAARPAGPIIAWHDGRGEETVASLERRFGPDLPRWTGRRVRSVSSVAKLGWLIDHGVPAPELWLGVPEIVLFLLTGAEATEHSLAARTGAYHVLERRFLPEVVAHVLGRADEPPDGLFPPVRAAGTAMGFMSDEAAARFGLPAGIPVTIAGHDHLAAAAGLVARPDDLFNSVGTAETLFRRVNTAPDVDRALELDLAVTVWPGGEAWGVLASATRSGIVVDALAAHLGMEPGELDVLAGEVPAGPPARMWAATLRILSRRTAAAAGRVAEVAGPHRRMVVFGGGSRSPVWLRLKASEIGVPVLACPVAEATARGAALAAGVAAGWWPTPSAGPAAGTMGPS